MKVDIEKIAVFGDKEDYERFKPIGSVYTFDEFMDLAEDGYIIDYDGSADICHNSRRIKNAIVCLDSKYIAIGEHHYSFKDFRKSFDISEFEFFWYNK